MAGIIDKYLTDPEVSDIYLDAWDQGWVIKKGVKQRAELFRSPQALVNWVNQQLKPNGKALTASNPVENCVMNDGSRLFAFAPPIASSIGLAIRTHRPA